MNYGPKKSINATIFFVLLFFLIVYGFFQARNLLTGPQIEIENPLDGSVLTVPEIEIRGQARNIAFINLNDGQIFVDDGGYFNEKLIAQPGYNIIKLSAEDRFGRSIEKFIQIVYDSPQIEAEAPSEEKSPEEIESGDIKEETE